MKLPPFASLTPQQSCGELNPHGNKVALGRFELPSTDPESALRNSQKKTVYPWPLDDGALRLLQFNDLLKLI